MAIKLLISDLDGTLLGPEGTITPRTACALHRAQQAGIRLLVATGRSWTTAAALLQAAEIHCDFVLLNGAEYRTADGTLQHAVSIQAEDARHAVSLLRRYNLDVEINTDQGDYSTDIALCSTAEPLPELSSFWDRKHQVRKIFAFSRNPEVLARAEEELQTIPRLTVVSSADWNLELTAPEAKKGQTALWVAAHTGIRPEEALVFGDGRNDINLFRSFVHTCAMGNGTTELKSIAERVVESNAQDGVARELERLLDEGFCDR